MINKKRIEDEETYQMIWRFTIVPWLIAFIYTFSTIVLLNYIGTSM